MVLAFDCVLRRLDARNRQVFRDMSELYRANNVIGFGTYGEQYRSMHLNQTLTGIAFGHAAGSGVAPCPIRDIDDIERLKKINEALISRVERSMDQQGNAFTLFQTAINLEGRIKARTEELRSTLRRLEHSNTDLVAAKENAERANLSKTRFLAAASHDVLQPLNAAHLSISALADLQTSEEGRKLVRQVERSLETMDDLLRTLLDISKLDAGVVRPDVANVPLEPLFAALRSDFQPLAAKKGLKLRFRPTALVVRSDRTLLSRILQNIVSNALRYTRSGGVLVGARQRGGIVLIDVADTGCGIPEDQHQAIYEEFHRGPMTAHGELSGGGLGLGLSIVRRMVDALGHSISFRSVVGRGTVFRLELPAGACRQDGGRRADGRTGAAARLRPVRHQGAARSTTTARCSKRCACCWSAGNATCAPPLRPTRRSTISATPAGCPTSSSPTSISTRASSARKRSSRRAPTCSATCRR